MHISVYENWILTHYSLTKVLPQYFVFLIISQVSTICIYFQKNRRQMCPYICHKLAIRHRASYMHLASFFELHSSPAATYRLDCLQGATADSQVFTMEVPALIPHLGRRVCWMPHINELAVSSLLSACNNASLIVLVLKHSEQLF